jgi:ribosomal protein S19
MVVANFLMKQKYLNFLSYKRRSIWKGPFLLIFLRNYFYSNFKILKKNFVIGGLEINNIYKIYNGKVFINLRVKRNFCGLKFGQFILTKKFGSHLRKLKIIKKK